MTPLVRLVRIARPVWGRLGLAVLLGTCAALAAIGLMAASGYLISRASQEPPILTLTTVIVSVRFFGISRGVFRYLERLVGHDAALRVLADLRVDVYRGLAAQSPTGLASFRSGELLARFVGDVDVLQELYLRVIPPFGVAAVVALLVVAGETWLVPAAGAVTAAGFALAVVLVPWASVRVSQRAEQRLTTIRGELSAELVELLQTAPELVVAGTDALGRQRVTSVDARLRVAERRVAVGSGVGAALGLTVTGVTVVCCLLLGSAAVASGQLDGVWLAVVVLMPLAAFELAAPLPVAAAYGQQVRSAAERVFSIVDAAPPVAPPAAPLPVGPPPHRLELAGVAARWPGQTDDAVAGIDLVLAPGCAVALVGPSGCGKTTIANVALRFLDPTSGSARLDGVDLCRLEPDGLRGVVGLLGQDAHIFDTTLRGNVHLARRDASDGELRAALREARLLPWIETLPDGLDTRVGEHGAQLSGGQRQRLALARVLLRDFPIVILDEPTEHLDVDTADELLTDLLDATRGRSTLLISHRLRGLSDVDEVVVVEHGRVVQRGSHADLLARRGWYARAWQAEVDAAQLLATTPGRA